MGGANFAYFCSTPGILKLISIVVVFFSQGLIAYGYWYADYIRDNKEPSCNERQKAGLDDYCPIAAGIVWSVVITMISFWASLIMYILHLLFELNKTIFKLVDWIGHFVGGLMMVIAGVVSIIYSIQAYWAIPCGNCKENTICVEIDSKCQELRTNKYQPLWVLIGGICAIFTGVVYIGVGIAIKKQPSD